jgi:hypothetical protein
VILLHFNHIIGVLRISRMAHQTRSGVAARLLDAHRAVLLLAASVLTVGSSLRRPQASSPSRLERNYLENAIPTGDRGFESCSLLWGVTCEPPIGLRRPSGHGPRPPEPNDMMQESLPSRSRKPTARNRLANSAQPGGARTAGKGRFEPLARGRGRSMISTGPRMASPGGKPSFATFVASRSY